MLRSAQLRAARALLGFDQRRLAAAAGLSLPTIQRMEGSDGLIRGNVESLAKLVEALDRAGVELIGDGMQSLGGGYGVRLKASLSAPRAQPEGETGAEAGSDSDSEARSDPAAGAQADGGLDGGPARDSERDTDTDTDGSPDRLADPPGPIAAGAAPAGIGV